MMNPSIEDIAGVTFITPGVEELDVVNSTAFREQTGGIVESHRKVVLDLSRVGFIDSSGIGALLSCVRRAEAAGGEIKLCNLTPSVRATLQLVRLHRVIQILNNRHEAMTAFGASLETLAPVV